jgi:uncharacterized protein YdhG (YjbR/CyaY superfamily)
VKGEGTVDGTNDDPATGTASGRLMATKSTPITGAEATAWIDAYLATLPEDQRSALEDLRRTIAAVAPEAVETISYAMPAFRYHGRGLVSYMAFKAHCSFFPMGAWDQYRERLVGFAVDKGTIRFTPERPLPTDIVEAIVHDRMAAIDAKRRH